LHWPELLAKKQKGLPAAAKKSAPDNVVNLMDALRASLKSSGKASAPAAKPAKAPAKKAAKKRKAG
jgi:DNA end-binding protein Ku